MQEPEQELALVQLQNKGGASGGGQLAGPFRGCVFEMAPEFEL